MRQVLETVNQERHIPANRKAQILLLLLTVTVIFFLLVMQWLNGLLIPPEGSPRAALDDYAHTVYRVTWLVFAISIPFTAVWSVYLARMGIRGLACREFPPPGTLVVMKTRIRSGTMALVSSCMAIFMAAAFWVPVLALAYSLFLMDKYIY